MAQRSRKRGGSGRAGTTRQGAAARPRQDAAADAHAASEPAEAARASDAGADAAGTTRASGARANAARARRTSDAGAGATSVAPAPRLSRSERTEQRNAEARAALVPLADGERPGAVTVGAIVAVALAILIVVGYATGARVGGQGSVVGAIFLAGILLVAAGGMWRARYWAVLGFQALLAFQILIAAISLAVASNWWAVLVCVGVIGLGGWLFWKLVRAMARIQMPERRPAP